MRRGLRLCEADFSGLRHSLKKQAFANNHANLPASPCSPLVTPCHLISHRHVNVRSTSRAQRRPSDVTRRAVPQWNRVAKESRNREWFRSASTRMTLSDSMPLPRCRGFMPSSCGRQRPSVKSASWVTASPAGCRLRARESGAPLDAYGRDLKPSSSCPTGTSPRFTACFRPPTAVPAAGPLPHGPHSEADICA